MERLRKQKDIERVLREGRRSFSSLLTCYINLQTVAGVSRAAVIVGARVSKRAVVRNRIRRRVREAIRAELQEGGLPGRGVDIIVLPRVGALEAPFAALRHQIRGAPLPGRKR